MSDIAFYFDFSSPYGYFASHRVEQVAARHGRGVSWHPVMLGAIMKETGNRPLAEQPLKGGYALHDWERLGRLYGVPWVVPESFPIAALAPSRAFWWLFDRDPEGAVRFAKAAYGAYFGEGRDISEVEVTAEVAASLGLDSTGLADAVADPTVKARLRDETEVAAKHGVCGSPFFLVDGEGFWGVDRLPMVDEWLSRGGW